MGVAENGAGSPQETRQDAQVFEDVNARLMGWLERLDIAVRSLREFAGENKQPSRFHGMDQWFQVPEGNTVSVTPPKGEMVDGGRYFAYEENRHVPKYTNKEPFTGGIAVKAALSDRGEGIVADLIVVQPNPGSGPPVFGDEAPNLKFFAHAIFIPDRLRPTTATLEPQVAIAIVDGSIQPIAQG